MNQVVITPIAGITPIEAGMRVAGIPFKTISSLKNQIYSLPNDSHEAQILTRGFQQAKRIAREIVNSIYAQYTDKYGKRET